MPDVVEFRQFMSFRVGWMPAFCRSVWLLAQLISSEPPAAERTQEKSSARERDLWTSSYYSLLPKEATVSDVIGVKLYSSHTKSLLS